MDWGWRFLTEWEVLVFVLGPSIFGALFLLLVEVGKMRKEIRDLLTEIRDALEKE